MFRLARALLQDPCKRKWATNLKHSAYLKTQGSAYYSIFIHPPDDAVVELTTITIGERLGVSEIVTDKQDILKIIKQRKELMKLLPTKEDKLPPRTMKDSFAMSKIPLSTDRHMRELFGTVTGRVRIGRILESMDALAVYCGTQHILNPKSVGKPNPYVLVTAAVDHIRVVQDRLKNHEDVRFSGHASFVGKSAMEVSIMVDQKTDQGGYLKCIESVFLLVARDTLGTGPARINPLVAENKEEEEFLKRRAERQMRRKQRDEESLFRKTPNDEERTHIHNICLDQMAHKRSNKVKMRDTLQRSTIVCQPENSNQYHKLFGGFIMRNAYELAYSTALIFAKNRIRMVFIDDIKFHLPVELGTVLQFKSYVGYVEKNYIHTIVVAEMVEMKKYEKLKTSVFNVAFKVEGVSELPEIAFETYKEAVYYLNSRRHFKNMMNEIGGSL